MKKLEFVDVEWKNFLSYGKIPQKITFTPGINLIIGQNKDINRSNMAGKSSCMETIPFALFGKLNRGIKKDNIVNWKNRKNCEVILNFKNGDDRFKILRKIKPDGLEIYHNDVLIPISADVRDYQKILEREILELDFNTFISLIHTNLNSLTPILKLDTQKKRQFLERVFNLGIFSDIVEKGNSKIRRINENINKINIESEFNNKRSSELINQLSILKTKLNGFISSINDLTSKKEELAKINCEEIDNTSLENELKELKLLYASTQQSKFSIDISIASFQKEIEILSKNINRKYLNEENIEKKLKQLKQYNVENIIEDLEKHKSDYTKEVEKSKELLTDCISKIFAWKLMKKDLEEKQKQLSGKNICPLCDSLLSKNKIDSDISNKLKDIEEKKLFKTENKKKDTEEKIEELNKEIKEIEGKIKLYSDIPVEIERYEAAITIKNKTTNLVSMVEQSQKIENELKILDNNIKTLDTKISNNIYTKNRINELKNTILLLEKSVEHEEKERLQLENDIVKFENEQDELNNIITNNKSQHKKYNEMIDYLECIKVLAKDENVKQYAISSKIPFISQQTNDYLSQSGCNFYVILKGWLDDEIKGPGITQCSYGNLSGSEARSIDLALQIAFLDILRLQSGVFPDIIIFDEILDSSIDAKGLVSLLDIIKNKQLKESLKIFLITHRQEISDLEVDKTYLAKKEKGFSVLI